jgi:hypothetical protein
VQSDTPSSKSKSPSPSQNLQIELAQTKKFMDDALDRRFATFFPARIIAVNRTSGIFNTLSIREVKERLVAKEEEREELEHYETMKYAMPLCPPSNDSFVFKPYSSVPSGFHAGTKTDTTFHDVVNATVFRMLSGDMPAFRDYNFCDSGSGEL